MEPLTFDVFQDSGEIVVADYEPNTSRYSAYDVTPDDLKFSGGMYDLLDRIQALRSEIYSYSNDVGDLEALEDYETEELYAFIEALTDHQRAELIQHLKRWFANEPDYEERDSNDIVRPMDGRQLAFRMFWDFDAEVLDALGIVVVEGDHPGSTYYAAEMTRSVENANEQATRLGLSWNFRWAQ